MTAKHATHRSWRLHLGQLLRRDFAELLSAPCGAFSELGRGRCILYRSHPNRLDLLRQPPPRSEMLQQPGPQFPAQRHPLPLNAPKQAGTMAGERKARVRKTHNIQECSGTSPSRPTLTQICKWRRRRDSNPRDGFPPTPLAGERLRPLGHVSADRSIEMGGDLQGGNSSACALRVVTAPACATLRSIGQGRRTRPTNPCRGFC